MLDGGPAGRQAGRQAEAPARSVLFLFPYSFFFFIEFYVHPRSLSVSDYVAVGSRRPCSAFTVILRANLRGLEEIRSF